jgi:hypothetical protein
MPIYYLANPENEQATRLVKDRKAPTDPHIDSFWPFLLPPGAAFFAWISTIDHGRVMAIPFSIASFVFLIWAIVECEPHLRRNRKHFRKLLASGEIVVVSDEVLTELRVHLYAVGLIRSSEEQDALRESFADVVALHALLLEIDSVGQLSEENLWRRALVLEQRSKRIVRVVLGKQIALATGQQVETNLRNDWVRERLRNEVDG